ncbi:hypothetical protein MetfoDRAFT_0906 [Methanotorris formicicus Mc-S-70]|uniref:Uncharacterized protein n=1 Tax=Methanotorris formicicus Mc-S-70 TaxID=647171 RepID=H1KYN3_9EURY|nr:hypothetical protein MetfoDRAFT_0906 [Methanotorris formicicus Mc-S-70]
MVFIGVSVLTCANLDNPSEQLNPKLFIELVSILLSAVSIGDAPFFNELFKCYLFLFFGFNFNSVKSHYQ